MADLIDKFAHLAGSDREGIIDLLAEESVGEEDFSDAYLDLLRLADPKCSNCPNLPRRALLALTADGDLDEVKADVKRINEEGSCVYGARLVVGEDFILEYQCTGEDYLRLQGVDPFGDPNKFD